MKKIIVFSLVAMFAAGSVMAKNMPQQATNSNAPKVSQDKDKDHDRDEHHRHHRHHHHREHKENK